MSMPKGKQAILAQNDNDGKWLKLSRNKVDSPADRQVLLTAYSRHCLRIEDAYHQGQEGWPVPVLP